MSAIGGDWIGGNGTPRQKNPGFPMTRNVSRHLIFSLAERQAAPTPLEPARARAAQRLPPVSLRRSELRLLLAIPVPDIGTAATAIR